MVTDMRTSLNEGQSRVDGNIGDCSLRDELQAVLRMQRNGGTVDRGSDINIFRSGSAPPTVEGSLSAVGSLFRNSDFNEINHRSNNNNNTNGVLTEDEIRSHPAYLSYYYSHENINPRLPPPMLSKEDWRIAQRFQAGSSFGGSGDWERRRSLVDNDSSSLFSRQPERSVPMVESGLTESRKVTGRHLPRQASGDWLERGSDGLIGLSSAGLGLRTKSFADILQEGLDRPASLSVPLSRPASRNAFGDIVDGNVISDCHHGDLCNGVEPINNLHSKANAPGNVRLQNPRATVSHSFPSAVGSSLSRGTTPESQLVARPSVSRLPPFSNRAYPVEKSINMNLQNGLSSSMNDLSDIAAALSSLSFSRNRCVDENSSFQPQLHAEFDNQSDFLLSMPNGNNQSVQQQLNDKSKAEKLFPSTNHLDLARKNGILTDLEGQLNFPKRTFSSASLYSKVNSSGLSSLEGSSSQNVNIPSIDFTCDVPNRYPVNQKLNSVMSNHTDAGPALSGARDLQSLNRSANQVGPDLHSSYVEPHGVHCFKGISDYATCTASGLGNPPPMRNYINPSHGDFLGLQKAYLETLLAQQKQQYELPLLGKSSGLNQGYYGKTSHGLGMAYPGNPMAKSAFPSVGSGNPMFQSDQISCFNAMMRTPMGGPITPWHTDTSNMEGRFASTLLEEFKSNKTRSFELSDIVDHVIEFSTDQYGSRFIQQKLETATVEEKTKIFPEIIPHSRVLMTDVFGNYVIQKFFEHGTESQRKALASELTGHVLPLSLQMYGCRVIQKALEVVNMDQQTQMVAELDGSVMKCVRDQNGNHVIQKCIECVPQDRIQFIISSFYGQVVALSTHPYGCRVIQRVLEHCDDSNTQQIIMDEIMQSVCVLAHDQYGNYVIQHVLQYGKPQERSAIISKLAGHIVKMSQQKFASNVVEKCLTFGAPEERQLLVREMLGSTDENEPLQIMMKDPFGNYVVQKVIETCDDQTRELILSRIKVHLNALKRYTYGKHIVARVEKLIAAGERRMGLSSSFSS